MGKKAYKRQQQKFFIILPSQVPFCFEKKEKFMEILASKRKNECLKNPSVLKQNTYFSDWKWIYALCDLKKK